LAFQDGFEFFHGTVTIDLTFRIKKGGEKGYTLQVIPMKMREKQMEPFYLWFPNSKAVPQFA